MHIILGCQTGIDWDTITNLPVKNHSES